MCTEAERVGAKKAKATVTGNLVCRLCTERPGAKRVRATVLERLGMPLVFTCALRGLAKKVWATVTERLGIRNVRATVCHLCTDGGGDKGMGNGN